MGPLSTHLKTSFVSFIFLLSLGNFLLLTSLSFPSIDLDVTTGLIFVSKKSLCVFFKHDWSFLKWLTLLNIALEFYLIVALGAVLCVVSPFTYTFPVLIYHLCFVHRRPHWGKVLFHCAFDQNFPNDYNKSSQCGTSLTECLFRFSGHSKSWLIYFYVVRFWSSLYARNTHHKYFLPSVGCFLLR